MSWGETNVQGREHGLRPEGRAAGAPSRGREPESQYVSPLEDVPGRQLFVLGLSLLMWCQERSVYDESRLLHGPCGDRLKAILFILNRCACPGARRGSQTATSAILSHQHGAAANAIHPHVMS